MHIFEHTDVGNRSANPVTGTGKMVSFYHQRNADIGVDRGIGSVKSVAHVIRDLPSQEKASSKRVRLSMMKFWGVAKLVRHKVLILACVGSSPATPAIFIKPYLENKHG